MKIAIAPGYEVTLPNRGTPKSAGLDFYIPSLSTAMISDFNARNQDARTQSYMDLDKKQINIHPQGRVFIPLGITVDVPKDCMLMVANKSGVSWDGRITNLSMVIDEDYHGNLFVSVYNYTIGKTVLYPGQKFIQLVCVPVFYPSVEVVPYDEVHLVSSVRGTGSMGSTGT